jgi:heme/copper-type cytochrome/quinol oxidase subunit 2
MHQLRSKLTGLAVVSLLFVVCAVGFYHPPASAALFTNSRSTACQALSGSCDSGATSVNRIIGDVIGILSFIVGVVAVVMVIVGALRYITSNGDSNQTASAKNTIIYALVGLVVAVLAQAIVQFVFNKV